MCVGIPSVGSILELAAVKGYLSMKMSVHASFVRDFGHRGILRLTSTASLYWRKANLSYDYIDPCCRPWSTPNVGAHQRMRSVTVHACTNMQVNYTRKCRNMLLRTLYITLVQLVATAQRYHCTLGSATDRTSSVVFSPDYQETQTS